MSGMLICYLFRNERKRNARAETVLNCFRISSKIIGREICHVLIIFGDNSSLIPDVFYLFFYRWHMHERFGQVGRCTETEHSDRYMLRKMLQQVFADSIFFVLRKREAAAFDNGDRRFQILE